MSARSQCWGAHAACMLVLATGRDASQESAPALTEVSGGPPETAMLQAHLTPAACATQADALRRVL
jgi:hypothetical protein